MKNGYKILWSDFALKELENTISYLEENWTQKEIQRLAITIEEILILISQNPNLFQASEFKKDMRRVVILSHNTLYYRVKSNQIEIISFFPIDKNQKNKLAYKQYF